MSKPKFEYKECECTSYDSVCNCYDVRKYEYLKAELEKLIADSCTCGDDIKAELKSTLAEVEKPYEEAKVSNTPALDALYK